MTSFHNLYLLLCCCVCPSNVLQGHVLTVSVFPQVNVPVGSGGYNNLVPCRPHWEEQDAYGRCCHLFVGLPLGVWRCIYLLPLDTKGSSPPLLGSVRPLSLTSGLHSPNKWESCEYGSSNQLLPAGSKQYQLPKVPHSPERDAAPAGTAPLVGWREIAKAYITSKEKFVSI